MSLDEMDRARGRELRAPHLHAPRGGGNGSTPSNPRRVVWMAFGWDAVTKRLQRVAPAAEDLGPVRVTGWSSGAADGLIVAVRHDGAELWGRAWRVDETAIAALAYQRHPRGVLELVTAVDALDRSLEVQLLALGDASASGRPTLLEGGWAVRGAVDAGLPLPWRRSLRAAPLRRRGGTPA